MLVYRAGQTKTLLIYVLRDQWDSVCEVEREGREGEEEKTCCKLLFFFETKNREKICAEIIIYCKSAQLVCDTHTHDFF